MWVSRPIKWYLCYPENISIDQLVSGFHLCFKNTTFICKCAQNRYAIHAFHCAINRIYHTPNLLIASPLAMQIETKIELARVKVMLQFLKISINWQVIFVSVIISLLSLAFKQVTRANVMVSSRFVFFLKVLILVSL